MSLLVSMMPDVAPRVADLSSRGDLRRTLLVRGFDANRYGSAVGVLRSLSSGKRGQVFGLLDVIHNHITNTLKIQATLFSLVLPSMDDLRMLPIDEIIKSSEVMNRVFEDCIMPSGRRIVDLSTLPWIYKMATSKPAVPPS